MRTWWPVARDVARRPGLWWTALRQGRRLARRGWWRSWPPLPLPSREYLALRAVTQYGDPGQAPGTDDVVRWLEWSKSAGWLRDAG